MTLNHNKRIGFCVGVLELTLTNQNMYLLLYIKGTIRIMKKNLIGIYGS